MSGNRTSRKPWDTKPVVAVRRGLHLGARMLGHLHGGRADGTCELWLLVRTRSGQRTHRLDDNGDRNRSECCERLGGLLKFYRRPRSSIDRVSAHDGKGQNVRGESSVALPGPPGSFRKVSTWGSRRT